MTTFTQTCPQDAPAEGPYRASSWEGIHPGLVRFSGSSSQTVTSAGGNPATGAAIDPITGGGDACRTVATERAPGTAVYLGPRSGGYTLMGLPKVIAAIRTTGLWGELDSRLWDVAPDGSQRLVSRGAFRLTPNQSGQVTFQLLGNGYRFAPGHRPKLELLGKDEPFLRPSNFPFTVEVRSATVELPTLERSPSGGGAGARGCTRNGTGGDDVIRGGPGPDVICAGGGDDIVYGLGGDDALVGGSGNDILRGGDGDDQLEGEAGNDQLLGGPGDDRLDGGSGRDSLSGQAADDSLEAEDGTSGNDVANGGDGIDACRADTGDVRTACE